MTVLSIDFETASDVDIFKEGAYKYAAHPSTEILMMGWAFDDEPVEVWLPEEPFPERILDHITCAYEIHAWNANFERLIWPKLRLTYEVFPEQFVCTAARAAVHGLPRKLSDCGKALYLPIQKLPEGRRLIQTYCCRYNDDYVPFSKAPAADRQLFIDYCRVDVESERLIGKHLRPLTETEKAEYHLNERINDRGIPVDVQLATCAVEYTSVVKADVNNQLALLTDNVITRSGQRNARDQWVLPQLNEQQMKLITKVRTHTDADTGEKVEERKITFDKAHRFGLSIHPDLPQPVAKYLELMEEAGGSTLAKYTAMVNKADEDGRVRGSIIFNGAGRTGRFSSLGLQVHNFKRMDDDEFKPQPIIDAVLAGFEIEQPAATLGKLVRAAITSKQGLSWFDFSGVEGRIAPWLADSRLGNKKLQLYADGVDPYLVNAKEYYRRGFEEGNKTQRQMGKVMELALQFLGGKGALQSMARNYNLHIEDDEAEAMKYTWRKANPWAEQSAKRYEQAAMRAVRKKGEVFSAGRLSYCCQGDWLWCALPSGRCIAYFAPLLELVETPWGEEKLALTVIMGTAKVKAGEAPLRVAMYPGRFLQNPTQAVGADLLREALLRVDAAGFPIVLHVHDEIVVEGRDYEEWADLMLQLPEWAHGLPLVGDGDNGERYGK